MKIERFAPSPTGLLHLGHAYSALLAYNSAIRSGGKFFIRIEDIDQIRCKKLFIEQILDDLKWLGINYEKPILKQSSRFKFYKKTLQSLWDNNYLFGCDCTRKDINIASAPNEKTLYGPDGIIYPNTCLNKIRSKKMPSTALRLNLNSLDKNNFSFFDKIYGKISFTKEEAIENIGSVILARKDIGISYHLSVVLDDAFQGITNVTRGEDLLEATKIHVILQYILNLPTPVYHHHKLIRDEFGKRLAKRDDARSIKNYRESGYSREKIIKMLN